MSKIIAIDNFKTGDWEVSFIDLEPNDAELYIGFLDHDAVINFQDLKFKYELRKDGNIKKHGLFPPPRIRYISSDQQFLVVEKLNFETEAEYELYLWAENNGKFSEKTVSFTTPRPDQPYSSWTWDGIKWIPPVSYPDDDDSYTWNEEQQKWEYWKPQLPTE